jgi:hypothetical protein
VGDNGKNDISGCPQIAIFKDGLTYEKIYG